MSLQTIEIEAFSGPTSVLIGGGNQPTIVYINQGPAGSSSSSTWGSITGTLSSQTDLQDALDLKANLASPTFTGTVVLPSATSIGNVSATEIGYVDGVTSAIQTQLNAKAPLASPTFTGTVSGITKSMVGLSNVDNTSDVNKPVSTAQQTALDLKANLESPTFTGIVTAPRITGRCDGLEVLCKAGLAIAAGQVVYVTGASGHNIVIGLARANAEATSSKTIGISESTLANNATGYVITEGLMTVSISAPTANEGDPIWLSPTTAGSMVFGLANKPSAPNHIVYLGVVTRKTGNTVVEIYVKIQNGAELDELSDVSITSPVAGQALMRGASLWENRALVSNDISDSSTGGNGTADAGKLVEFGSTGGVLTATVNKVTITQPANGATLTIANGQTINAGSSITTNATSGYIQTGEYASITTGSSGYILTGNAGWIQTGENGYIQTAAGASIQTSVNGQILTSTGGSIITSVNAYIEAGASISTGTGGYIQTATNAPITTATNGYISTGANAPISTLNGGSITTGTGNLLGPNTSGTIALTNPSTGTQTFSGAQIFDSTTRPTSSGTGTPAATSLITLADGDARYGATGLAGTSIISITSQITPQTIRSATLAVGLYHIRMVFLLAGTANTGTRHGYNFSGTSTVRFFRSRASSPTLVQVTSNPFDQPLTEANTSAVIEGIISVTVAGTFSMQAAQNTSHPDVLSVGASNHMIITPCPKGSIS